MKLEDRFIQLTQKYTQDQAVIQQLWTTIVTKYSEAHRAYHNLQHLQELFSYVDTYTNNLQQPDKVSFSIFYHDIIYQIWKKDNEEQSAVLAVQELKKIDLSMEALHGIEQQIIATKTHEASDTDTQFLVDFDLTILGQPPEIYENYTQQIRKEYRLVPQFMYTKGRKKVLQHFLEKKFIYHTPICKTLFEAQARKNLINELNNL